MGRVPLFDLGHLHDRLSPLEQRWVGIDDVRWHVVQGARAQGADLGQDRQISNGDLVSAEEGAARLLEDG